VENKQVDEDGLPIESIDSDEEEEKEKLEAEIRIKKGILHSRSIKGGQVTSRLPVFSPAEKDFEIEFSMWKERVEMKAFHPETQMYSTQNEHLDAGSSKSGSKEMILTVADLIVLVGDSNIRSVEVSSMKKLIKGLNY
jgi:hypothetical protein